ncbi:MgtC/SapB family protein [Caballeronia novacaledonica]|jgi:putative Mg2+ transporter-C (MgtC) family protein|uniref:Protein MgtC n=3 Tax=Caballeronia TaxID=1827195 RepID=A0AA37MSS2_9BURK|nr:MgtC/SapB family protein [Caballeronia novacaledonica]GJH21532.1 MgtC/SapB family protein [Caballeronia novacaledonica]GJH30331.1 MgtC/SapB family protein [Caballeronia novacaledonica]
MLPYPLLVDAVLRMLSAMLIGCIIGIDRDLHGKPTGMKTLGLVSLGACIATMCAQGFSMTPSDDTGVSRAVQGIVTGVGFLGAGVILQNPRENRVRGLTTAASIWVTAAVGIVCGLGVWSVAFIAMILMIALMTIGRVVEKRLLRRWMSKPEDERQKYGDVEEV